MTAESTSTLKSILKAFLSKDPLIEFKQVKARVLAFNPLRISDNEKTYLEMTNFLKEEDRKTLNTPNKGHEIELIQWRFIFQRIPNTHDFFVDLEVDEYKLLEVDHPKQIDPIHMHSLIDEIEIQCLSETMRRMKMESLLNLPTERKAEPTLELDQIEDVSEGFKTDYKSIQKKHLMDDLIDFGDMMTASAMKESNKKDLIVDVPISSSGKKPFSMDHVKRNLRNIFEEIDREEEQRTKKTSNGQKAKNLVVMYEALRKRMIKWSDLTFNEETIGVYLQSSKLIKTD